MSTASLYTRLGGNEGIESLIDTIVDTHMRNPEIKARFLPYRDDPQRMDEIKRHLCQFFAAGSGGPEEYSGRSMLDTHRGMNISAAEYLAVVDDIMSALQAHSMDEQTQKDVLAIAYSLKDEILHA